MGIKPASCPTKELLVNAKIKYHDCMTGDSLLDQALLWLQGFTDVAQAAWLQLELGVWEQLRTVSISITH